MSLIQERSKRLADAVRNKMDIEKIRLDAERLSLDTQKLQLERDKFCVDVLIKEYQNRFSEVVFHSGRYHKQVNFIQLYLTVLGSFFAILFSKDWSVLLGALHNVNVLYVQSGLILAAYLISLYLFTNVMDSLYSIYMNGRRLSAIEQEVNKTLGRDVLVWDSEIVPRLYSTKKFFVGLWIRPNMILGIWSFLFFIGVTIALCCIAFYIANDFFYYFAPPAIFVSCMLIFNWFLLHSEGLEFIDAAIRRTDFDASTKSVSVVIVLANLLLAYAPMAMFSMRDNSFGWGMYTFPFCSIPSVWLGDATLMPIFDYFAIAWIYSQRQFAKGRMPAIAALSAVVAISAMSLLHWAWVNDAWTGFMDLASGKLSSAGWVHYVYSVVQLFIVMLTLGLFIADWQQHREEEFLKIRARQIRVAVGVLFAFSSLSIWDWYIRNISIFFRPFQVAFREDFVAFAPFLAMLFIFMLTLHRTRAVPNPAVEGSFAISPLAPSLLRQRPSVFNQPSIP